MAKEIEAKVYAALGIGKDKVTPLERPTEASAPPAPAAPPAAAPAPAARAQEPVKVPRAA